MLAIPSHNCEENAQSLKSGILNYLKSSFGDEVAIHVDNDVSALIELRHQVLQDNYAEDIFIKYNAQMKNVCSRFPVNTLEFKPSQILPGNTSKFFNKKSTSIQTSSNALKFTWNDAYKPSMNSANSSFLYDWINCLWNVGATLSKIGAQCNRSTDEGIKNANKYFQQSAGVFDYIQQIISTTAQARISSISSSILALPCLSAESLTFVKQLLLAQAQLCFYEKAVRDKKNTGTMKNSVIAKLAFQSSNLFKAALAACKVGVISSILDPSWPHHVEYQVSICSAAAEYWQSQAAKELAAIEAKGFAEEITRLHQAEVHLNQALNLISSYKLSTTLSDSVNAFLRTVITSKQNAESDNRTVYMEPIPSYSSLNSVSGLMMVKPIFPQALEIAEPVALLFKDVLPKEIKDVKEKLDEKLQNIVRQVTMEANESTNVGRVVLSSVGLPGSVESFKSGGDIPDSLWEKVQRVQSLGGIAYIRSKLFEIYQSSQRTRMTLNQIESSVENERLQDEAFHTKHNKTGGNNLKELGLIPSKQLQQELVENLARFQNAFEQAQGSNDDATLRDILGESSVELQQATEQGMSATSLLKQITSSSIPLQQLQDFEKVLNCRMKSELIPQVLLIINTSKPKYQPDSKSNESVADLLDFDNSAPPDYCTIKSSANLNEGKTSNQMSTINELLQRLENRLIDMAQLIESRDQLVTEITSKVPIISANSLDLLINQMNSTFFSNSVGGDVPGLFPGASAATSTGFVTVNKYDDIVESTLKPLESIRSQVTDTITQQDSILKDILNLNEVFLNAVKTDAKTVERNIVITKIEQILAKYYHWYAQLNAGLTFYMNLQSRLSALLQTCDDLSLTQQLRRQEYETNLFQSFERTNQEANDHDLALKLAAEMNQPQPQPTPAYQPSAQPYPYFNQPGTVPSMIPPYAGPSTAAAPITQSSNYQPNPVGYGAPPQSYAFQTPGYSPEPYNGQPGVYNSYPSSQQNIPAPTYLTSLQPQSMNSSQPHQQHAQYPPQYSYQQPPYQSPPLQQIPQNYYPSPNNPGYQPAPSPPSEFDMKVSRIMDMGFKRHIAEHYLAKCKDNEEAAVNEILSASETTLNSIPITGTVASSNVNSTPATSKTGIFGNFWGKKN